MLQNWTMLYEEDQRRWFYELEKSTAKLVGDKEHSGHLENYKDEVNILVRTSHTREICECFLNASSGFVNDNDGEEDSAK